MSMRDIRRKLGVLVDDDDDDDDDDRKPQMMDIHRYSGSGVDTSYTQNRELSWLRFNERVLDEAMDSNVPLFERMKFIEIFTSNLDEFFMVRVGSLFDLKRIQPDKLENKGGMTPGQQLAAIFAEMPRLYKKRDDIYQKLQKQLETQGIVHLHVDDMGLEERQYFEQYFREQLLPVLSPQVIDLHHPFPHLENKELLVGALLKHERHVTLGMVPLAPSLPRFLLAPGNRMGYVLQEELIQAYLDKIFMNYPIIDRSVFTVTRDADINPDDEEVEYGEDYVKQMKNVLKKRRRVPPRHLPRNARIQSLGCTGPLLPRPPFLHNWYWPVLWRVARL